MLASKLYSPTLRELPADAVVMSHKYMLKAGMMRKIANGTYAYLPLAFRAIEKVKKIIREEINKTGAQEILMPIVQPSEIWQKTGRWAVYGEEMFKLQDRHGRDYCLAPTHEELVTTLVSMDTSSYKQLPVSVYQIQNKYRDEKRPRFGLMRSREFIMKDGYTFDMDQEGLDKQYKLMYDAYWRIFTRCGLKFRPVIADSGAIGGNASHEFEVLADSGEADIVYCEDCDFAANIEAVDPKTISCDIRNDKEKEIVETPGQHTIEMVCNFLNADVKQSVKAVVYKVMEMQDACCGANEKDKHYIHVNPARDFGDVKVDTIRQIQEGDVCPHCGGKIVITKGIEVGQVFKLGTKYSEALGATYLDNNGKSHPMVMGCYGIGVTRTVAASIEQNHDDDGIIWPVAIAPYEVVIVPANNKSEEVMDAAKKLYDAMEEKADEVVLDDRNERAGIKFKDADLIGYPVRVTIGNKWQQSGNVEIRLRRSGETIEVPYEECKDKVMEILAELHEKNR